MRVALAGLTVLMIASGCHTPSTSGSDRDISACLNLSGTIGSDSSCDVHDNTATYKIVMRFPTGYPDQEALADYLTQQRTDFVEWVDTAPDRTAHHELDVIGAAYRSGDRKSGTESLVLTIGNDTGVHPVATYKAFNYSLADHAPISLEALFKPGTNPVAVVKPFVAHEVLALDRNRGKALDDLTATSYQQFAITDDAIIFFFNQDGVLPHEDGPFQVAVPRSELASILN